MDRKVSVNILNYNTFEKSCVCIDSCLKQTGIDFQILLIDNASTDGSFEKIKQKYGNKIVYLQTGCNLGYAGGNNKSVEYCYTKGFKYAFLLNSDTELKGITLLKELYTVFNKDSNCSVVSPTIFDVTWQGLIKHTNDYSYNKWLRRIRVLPKLKRITDCIETVSEAHGSALMVDCSKFLAVGGFPEHYFMYCEESTFAKNTIWAGYDILWYQSEDNFILHHHDKTQYIDPWREYLMGRNRALEYCENKKRRNSLWRLFFSIFKWKMYLYGKYTHKMDYYIGMKTGISLANKKCSIKEFYNHGIMVKNTYI
ncbi:glycosyltransferase [Bacteroides sp. AN502(2024)]|uniref:glycosyltransferase n=1 Tax=Bacteroides sp. AN502(2024) TaxID=3160599 RepID=UPI003513EEEB